MRAFASLLVFLVLVGLAAGLGATFRPGAWYEALHKPPLTPPGWVFGPVWTVLYLGIALAGWLVWRTRAARAALAPWGAQLVANALWSPLFFGLQRPGWALLDVTILLALVIATTAAFLRVHAVAGALLVPYAAWVAFAAYLNGGIVLLNR